MFGVYCCGWSGRVGVGRSETGELEKLELIRAQFEQLKILLFLAVFKAILIMICG